MALATRPKPKAHHRKRQAKHHHHGKMYLKTYWPYLPMLIIVGLGIVVNKALYGVSSFSGGNAAIAGARVQHLTGSQSATLYLTILGITAVAFTYFILSHYRRFQKAFESSEQYLIKHPILEIVVVFIFTTGYILTRGVTV